MKKEGMGVIQVPIGLGKYGYTMKMLKENGLKVFIVDPKKLLKKK